MLLNHEEYYARMAAAIGEAWRAKKPAQRKRFLLTAKAWRLLAEVAAISRDDLRRPLTKH